MSCRRQQKSGEKLSMNYYIYLYIYVCDENFFLLMGMTAWAIMLRFFFSFHLSSSLLGLPFRFPHRSPLFLRTLLSYFLSIACVVSFVFAQCFACEQSLHLHYVACALICISSCLTLSFPFSSVRSSTSLSLHDISYIINPAQHIFGFRFPLYPRISFVCLSYLVRRIHYRVSSPPFVVLCQFLTR